MGASHRIHHGLELGLAKKAVGKAMDGYMERFAAYSPTFVWDTDTTGRMSFKAKGLEVTGEIKILGDEVTVDLDVPFIFRIFKGKAIEVVDREVKKWCEKARNGELE